MAVHASIILHIYVAIDSLVVSDGRAVSTFLVGFSKVVTSMYTHQGYP